MQKRPENSESKVTLRIEGDVAILRLNEPATMNAVSVAMAESLNEYLDFAEKNAGAAILTGEGRGFCSGANLNSGLASLPRNERDMGSSLESHFNPLLIRLRSLPIPFICAVNGPAVGIGCSLALIGDMIIAAENAIFVQSFSQLGLVPDGGAAFLLSAAIGRVRAMELMMLGENISARKACDWGLINRVTPDDELLPRSLEIAKVLSNGPKQSLAATRRIAWQALETPFEGMLKIEREEQRAAGLRPEFEERVNAFRKRRSAAKKEAG